MTEVNELIRKGEYDINNSELFFGILSKGLLYHLNSKIKLRDKYIPHYIVNTGDDILYLEVKGQNNAIEPLETVNENFVYTSVPRCVVNPGGINLLYDQLTSPYTHGLCNANYNDTVYGIVGEFRRMPLKMSFEIKYILDSFTDALSVVQQFITNMAIIQTYTISYLGQTIYCTFSIPDSVDTEKMIEFDGLSMEDKYKTISLTLEVETNLPIFYEKTAMDSNSYTTSTKASITPNLK